MPGVDVPYDNWVQDVLIPASLPAHVQQHIATMARLHRQDRYNRRTDDVERITGLHHRAPGRVQLSRSELIVSR